MKHTNNIILFLLTLVFCVPFILGATWYVAPDGNDSAAGTLALPLKTLNQSIVNASSGDTIRLFGGDYYTNSQNVTSYNATYINKSLYINAYNGTPIIHPNFTNAPTAILFWNSTYGTLENIVLNCSNGTSTVATGMVVNITALNVTNVTIKNCTETIAAKEAAAVRLINVNYNNGGKETVGTAQISSYWEYMAHVIYHGSVYSGASVNIYNGSTSLTTLTSGSNGWTTAAYPMLAYVNESGTTVYDNFNYTINVTISGITHSATLNMSTLAATNYTVFNFLTSEYQSTGDVACENVFENVMDSYGLAIIVAIILCVGLIVSALQVGIGGTLDMKTTLASIIVAGIILMLAAVTMGIIYSSLCTG